MRKQIWVAEPGNGVLTEATGKPRHVRTHRALSSRLSDSIVMRVMVYHRALA